MSFFANPTPIVKQLDEQHTVTARKLSFGERQRLTSECMTFNPLTQDMDIDYAKFQLESMKKRLAGWSGPEFDGVPCTPENVEKLAPEVADKILGLIDGREDALGDDEKKP